MTVFYEANHGTEWLVRGTTPATPDTVTVTVSGSTPWESGQLLGRVTATGKYVKYDPAATNGSQTAVGVLWSTLPPVAGDVRTGVLLRTAEVTSTKLIGLDMPARASLTTAGILVREGQPMQTTYTTPDYVGPDYVV
jgi:hypothetical protein